MDTIKFHESTVKEFLAIKDRVRNLIPHWGEDGRYKEAVLKTIIQRFLPEKYKIGTGFVVRQTRQRGNHESSSQIDLLIYDTSYPVLFRESDFVIVTPDAVQGIVEVKANVKNQGLERTINKSNEVGKFIFDARTDKIKPIYNGIFSYSGYEKMVNTNQVVSAIRNSWNILGEVENKDRFAVNHISLNQNWFYKFWHQEYEQLNPPHYLYEIRELSFSFFISNLIDAVSGNSVIENSNLWFPVDKSIQVRNRF
jgi:hypothetical protein